MAYIHATFWKPILEIKITVYIILNNYIKYDIPGFHGDENTRRFVLGCDAV